MTKLIILIQPNETTYLYVNNGDLRAVYHDACGIQEQNSSLSQIPIADTAILLFGHGLGTLEMFPATTPISRLYTELIRKTQQSSIVYSITRFGQLYIVPQIPENLIYTIKGLLQKRGIKSISYVTSLELFALLNCYIQFDHKPIVMEYGDDYLFTDGHAIAIETDPYILQAYKEIFMTTPYPYPAEKLHEQTTHLLELTDNSLNIREARPWMRMKKTPNKAINEAEWMYIVNNISEMPRQLASINLFKQTFEPQTKTINVLSKSIIRVGITLLISAILMLAADIVPFPVKYKDRTVTVPTNIVDPVTITDADMVYNRNDKYSLYVISNGTKDVATFISRDQAVAVAGQHSDFTVYKVEMNQQTVLSRVKVYPE